MKSHVLRPLLVVIGLVIVLLVFRHFYVPQDFAVHENGFTYGLYRTGAIADWQAVSVKYKGECSRAGSCIRIRRSSVRTVTGPREIIRTTPRSSRSTGRGRSA
jgi:hypothetical protein